MSRRNAIVCVDKNTKQVYATIGLMELFSLYVQGSWEARLIDSLYKFI